MTTAADRDNAAIFAKLLLVLLLENLKGVPLGEHATELPIFTNKNWVKDPDTGLRLYYERFRVFSGPGFRFQVVLGDQIYGCDCSMTEEDLLLGTDDICQQFARPMAASIAERIKGDSYTRSRSGLLQ